MKSISEFLGVGGRAPATASPSASRSLIEALREGDTSQMASQDLSRTTPSGLGDSSGSPTMETSRLLDAAAGEYSRTSAMSLLEEALTRKALTWCAMLGDPKLDVKTQIECFKLASEHLAKMRRAGGDDDDDATKTKLPGIDALRELMEGTAKKVVRADFDELLDEHAVLTLPAIRPQGGRPNATEQRRRERLAEAGLVHKPPRVLKTSRSKVGGGDDSGLAKLLNGKAK